MAQQVNSKHAQVVATPLGAEEAVARSDRLETQCPEETPELLLQHMATHTQQHRCLWEIWVRRVGAKHPSSGLTEKGKDGEEEGDFVSWKRDLGSFVEMSSVQMLSIFISHTIKYVIC